MSDEKVHCCAIAVAKIGNIIGKVAAAGVCINKDLFSIVATILCFTAESQDKNSLIIGFLALHLVVWVCLKESHQKLNIWYKPSYPNDFLSLLFTAWV